MAEKIVRITLEVSAGFLRLLNANVSIGSIHNLAKNGEEMTKTKTKKSNDWFRTLSAAALAESTNEV